MHNSKRQHALTINVFTSREQLRQKEDKRGRTREYQIVIHYSGKWLPLSQVNNPEFDIMCYTSSVFLVFHNLLSCVYLRQLCFSPCFNKYFRAVVFVPILPALMNREYLLRSDITLALAKCRTVHKLIQIKRPCKEIKMFVCSA